MNLDLNCIESGIQELVFADILKKLFTDSCNSTDFVCPDYSCVPMVTVCDGQENCPGGGDENNCCK